MTMLRWRPAGLPQGIAAVIVLLMAVRAIPAAPPPTVLGQLPVVLGHKMDQRADDLSADGPVARNLPIGQRIYRTVVELEAAAAGTVGEKVDIAHVTLGDEGPVAKTILRGILVVSNKPTTGAASDVVPAEPAELAADDTETAESADHPEFYETRLVGLAVTGGQLEWLRMAEAQGVLRIRPTEVHEAGSLAEELLHN
ncbi:MAG: hypothetical protein ACO37F_15015, partial [Pirellulales bacterium]